MVLIMTVNPGFGGQSFIPAMERKIKELKRIIDNNSLNVEIQVDGGVKLDNAKAIMNWGGDVLVAGSAILGGNNVAEKTKMFKNI